jgi:hypothetical protein
MRTRLIFFIVAVLSLTISPISLTSNAASSKLEILAITDTKPGEVEVTFNSKIAKSLITSYQITAKPKTATGASFSKSYKSKVSGLFSHKISKLTPEVEYIFTIRLTTKGKQVITSDRFNYLISSTTPTAPLITKAVATDADEVVLFFDAPIDDGGTTIYYYTALSNPGGISSLSPQRGPGSITITGLSKSTTYTFTINAFNINGSSLPSKPSLPVTTLAEKIVRTPTSSTTGPTLAAPAFTLSSSSQTVVVSNAITTVTNTPTGGAIASYAISPAAPAGLTFSTTTGQLSGTPTATQSSIPYTITATNAAGSATQTFTLTVSVAPAIKLAISRSSVGTAPGVAFTTQPQITVQDLGGNTITSSTTVVTATVSTGGTLVGTATATASLGVATFSNLGIRGYGDTAYTITYTAAGLITATQSVTPSALFVGNSGPGGGKIFYVATSTGFNCGPTNTEKCYYLEAAPTTDGTTNKWTDVLRFWSADANNNKSTSVPNAAGSAAAAIGAGYKNSLAIVAQTGNLEATSAAVAASEYRGPNNLTDWYLPSKDELNQMCKWQRGVAWISNATVCAGGTINTGSGAAGFVATDYYWSSSEHLPAYSWFQHFVNDPSQGFNAKGNPRYVRPIRAF